MSEDETAYAARWRELMRIGAAPPVHSRMGLQLVQLSPTTIVTMEINDEVRGLAPGSVHGGMLATLADVASATALWNAHSEDGIPATTDMQIRYFRQPRRGPLSAEAEVLHRGRRVLSTECTITDAESRRVARATLAYVIVPVSAMAPHGKDVQTLSLVDQEASVGALR
jgi:uncharacterized protein (TIGR00369 family)